jgi:hypothetical protein
LWQLLGETEENNNSKKYLERNCRDPIEVLYQDLTEETEENHKNKSISRWLPTSAGRIFVRAEYVEIVVDKAVLGQVFSEYFGFPCQSSFHQFLHHHNHPGLTQ